MQEILFDYHPVPATTWAYLSSLMTIALFFKFSRLWSMRNLDLVFLILFAPGLLMVRYGEELLGGARSASIEHVGFIWLFAIGFIFLVRLLVDPLMVRRPLLEPNLSVGGQTFTCVALLIFLMANVVTSKTTENDLQGSQRAEELGARQEAELVKDSLDRHGPGFPVLFLFPRIITQTIVTSAAPTTDEPSATPQPQMREAIDIATARTVAILAHLAVVLGMVTIGYRHFDNIKTGIAAATLYLLMPYTALHTGRVDHVLPAALLVWAVAAYRRPAVSGSLIGLAMGTVYYPVFLLPLWIGFYWQRGLWRFLLGALAMVAVLIATLAFRSSDMAVFLAQLKQMLGWRSPAMEYLEGFWRYNKGDTVHAVDPVFRLPVMAAFLAMCLGLSIWPAQKNLGTLMSCSAAVMLGAQFWHAYGGGLYMAWFLPLVLLTIFRPNLEDRVALSVLGEGWLSHRKARLRAMEQAA